MDDDTSGVALRDHLKACMSLPRRGIRFTGAIFALTGCRVIPFDRTASQDQDLLAKLKGAAETARREAAAKRDRHGSPERSGQQD